MRVDPVLLEHPYFAHFSTEQFDQLIECASRIRLPAGATLFAEGEESADCYIVESGSVLVQRSTPYGPYLATLVPGDIFGETGFIDGRSRSGDVLMETSSELLLLSPAAVRDRIEDDPKFAAALYWAFWKSLSAKLRATNDRLLDFFGSGSKTGLSIPRRLPEAPTPASSVGLDEKRKLFSEQKLSQMEINFLASVSKQLQFRAGQTIFREGDVGEHLYVVLDGKVRISKDVPGAGEEALSFLERGDYFGEMALIDARPRSADARAHSGGAMVLAIPKQVVDSLLHQRGVSSIRLLTLLCLLIAKRLRETDDKIVGWYVLSGGPSNSGG